VDIGVKNGTQAITLFFQSFSLLFESFDGDEQTFIFLVGPLIFVVHRLDL